MHDTIVGRKTVMSQCTICGGNIATGLRFCPSCGSPVPGALVGSSQAPTLAPSGAQARFCKMCGSDTRYDQNFCSNCGAAITKPETTPQTLQGQNAQLIPETPKIPVARSAAPGVVVGTASNAANWAGPAAWQGTVGLEPGDILALAMKAAGGAGLVTKESRYDYFSADGEKSPGKVLLGGLAYYLAAKTDNLRVRIDKSPVSGYIVSIEAKGRTGQQALNQLVYGLTQPAPVPVV